MLDYAAIARAVGGRLERGTGGSPARVVHDSREVAPGDLFVALKGERTDGHLHLAGAFARGAGGAIVSDASCVPPEAHDLVVVADTRLALWNLAKTWRAGLDATFVGITGTCGKTTTKELLAHLAAGERETFAVQGSYNTDVGLPLSLLAMPATARVGVFEIGAGAPGEIAPLARLLAPDVAVVTLVGRGHLAGFGDVATVAAEKWALVRALPQGGTAVVNADSAELLPLLATWRGNAVTFGTASGTLRGRLIADGPPLVVEAGPPPLSLTSPLVGRHNLTNLLAAVGAALAVGVSPRVIEERAATFVPPPHRLRLLAAPFGAVLDDTYNANPESTRAALEALAGLDLGTARRAFVFGEMRELGTDAARCHDEVLGLALRLGVRPIFPVGGEAVAAARRAERGARPGTFVFVRREDLPRRILELVSGERTLLLVKGSHLLALDQVVDALLQS